MNLVVHLTLNVMVTVALFVEGDELPKNPGTEMTPLCQDQAPLTVLSPTIVAVGLSEGDPPKTLVFPALCIARTIFLRFFDHFANAAGIYCVVIIVGSVSRLANPRVNLP